MIRNFWDDAEAARRAAQYHNPDVALRLYASELLARETRLILHGGGNGSVKTVVTDLLGDKIAVLCINGGGSCLSGIDAERLASVKLGPLSRSEQFAELSDVSAHDFLRCNLIDSAVPAPSIDTFLHAFLPQKYVDHSHPLDLLALVDQQESQSLIDQVFGSRVGFVPYIMPGFLLAKAAASEYRCNPQVMGLVLDKHGLVSFGDTARQSYERAVELNNLAADFIKRNRRESVFVSFGPLGKELAGQADIAPILRGCLAKSGSADNPRRWILDFRCSDLIRDFVNGRELIDYANRGMVTPEHVVRTKGKPLILPFPEASALEKFRCESEDAVARYIESYRAFLETNSDQLSLPELRLDAVPRIVLVRGCGLFGIGRSADEAAVVADFAESWVETVTAAESIGRFCSLGEDEQRRTEYHWLERGGLGNARELRFAGHVVLVTGGAGTIGRAIAKAFAREGAEIVIADLDGEKAAEVAGAIKQSAFGCVCDVCSSEALRSIFDRSCERFGGVDIVVSNAGAAWSGPIATVPDDLLRKSFELNFFSHQLVAQNAVRVLRLQRTGGAILFNVSKQAINPGRDFGVYGIPKAATLALVRQYAVEHGQDKIRVSAVNADRIRSGLLTEEMIRTRAQARGLSEEEYMRGNLLGLEVTAEDVAQAFVHQALAMKTTGAVTTVDGGNAAAFLR
jgi:rhamnose utilization protein RhaD (predicted bifunctional aldolase and dehydrogenase)/NAD(P)-dependent dehydrogenase (short-subunit alcohol dehydrogenase family)